MILRKIMNVCYEKHTKHKCRVFSFEPGRKQTNVHFQGAAFNRVGKRNSVDSDLISEPMDD